MKHALKTIVACCAVLAACSSDDRNAVTAPSESEVPLTIGTYEGGAYRGPTFQAPVRQFGGPAVGKFEGLTLSHEEREALIVAQAQAEGGGDPGWASHAPMTLGREGACIAAIKHKIYVLEGYGPPFGDSQTLQIYDVDANTWSMGPTSIVMRSEGIGIAHGDRLFCIGGRTFGSQNAVEIYDAAKNTYSLGAPMPTPRRGLAAAVVGNRIFAIGGSDGGSPQNGTPFDVNEVYNIAKNSWSIAAPMPTARMDVVAVAHGGKIYVVGGWNFLLCGGACNTLEIYDPAHDTWSSGPPMPTARGSLAVETKGNTLYAIAGATNLAFLTTFNEAYDIDQGTWSEATPKPSFTAETFGARQGGRIYVIGGGYFGLAFSPVPGAVNESFRP